MELELTFSCILRVWWAFLGRNIIATVGAVLVGFVLGAMIGMILGAFGGNLDGFKIYLQLFGGLIGLAISFIPPWFTLNRNYRDFRLSLVSTRTPNVPPILPQPVVDPDKTQEPKL